MCLPTNSNRPAHPRSLRLRKLQTSSHQRSILTPTGPWQHPQLDRTLPRAAHSRCIPSSSHKARSLPRGPDRVGAHGSRGGGESACARGARTPSAPYPALDSAPQLPRRPAKWVGRGLCKKENSRVCLGAGKSLVPTPFPRRLALSDSSGRGAGRACALGFVLRTRPGGGGEGAGLPPPHRPPHPSPAPRLHVGRPLPQRTACFPRGRLGSRSACPRVPARTNFLRVAGPTRPASLARLGVTDASETDFPLFQRKGELARAPQPPSPGPLPLPPPAAVTLRGPLLGSAAAGGGGGGRGCWRLATCTF